MTCIYIRPLGDVDSNVLAAVETMLKERYTADVVRWSAIPGPADAFDPKRGQYSSVAMLKSLMNSTTPGARDKVIGITERDLFIPMLTFVFGQAQLDGRYAVVSLARLRQEFYGLPESRPVLETRAVKEACHELGHTFGLAHCPDGNCPMSLSTTIRQVDEKSEEFCDACAAALGERGFAARGVRT